MKENIALSKIKDPTRSAGPAMMDVVWTAPVGKVSLSMAECVPVRILASLIFLNVPLLMAETQPVLTITRAYK